MFHLFDTCHSNKEAGTISEKRETVLSCCVFVSLFSYSKMAEARISVDQNEFICPVCLDLLKDPVVIPRGHSYCKSCITDCWDQEDEKRVYSFPQCRQTFSARPALAKSTMLAEVVDKLKKAKFLLTDKLEMCSVTSVLEENTKLSSLVWCVRKLAVILTLTVMTSFTLVSHTKWLMPLDNCRTWSAVNMINSWKCTVSLTNNAFVCCVRSMNIKTTKPYQVQLRGQKQYEITGIEMKISKPVSSFSLP